MTRLPLPNPPRGVRKAMCDSCAFKDPTAWTDDEDLLKKVMTSLEKGIPFTCHSNMPVDAAGHFAPVRRADGEIDLSQLDVCAGYALVRQKLLERQAQRERSVIPDMGKPFRQGVKGLFGTDAPLVHMEVADGAAACDEALKAPAVRVGTQAQVNCPRCLHLLMAGLVLGARRPRRA